jgi:ATP-dependent helicase HepA
VWTPGDRLTHRLNPELGLGVVVEVESRAVLVSFPRTGQTLRLAPAADVLVPVDLAPGLRVRLPSGEESRIAECLDGDRVRLDDGSQIQADALWPLEREGALLERLAAAHVDPVEDFALRFDALHLAARREEPGLGSFLGGRIRLFPHQLHVAERATAADPVRWLLADEVGLGKTVEACLILNHLVHTRGVGRCLVVAPDTLTVQWLGELWRKYHQVFALLDEERLADVKRDFGEGFNPFDAHSRAVVSLEMLVARPRLVEAAVAARPQLVVVDEAHRLRRPPGHPGEPPWRAVQPLAAAARHLLLLSATPLEDDAHGFFRLLQLLRPDELPEGVDFRERLARREPLPPCTSSTRRADIGGLPPRVGAPVGWPDDDPAWRERRRLETALRSAPATDALARKRRGERLRRALASGAALRAVLGKDERDLAAGAEAADASDPRLLWLLRRAPRWKRAGEKTLVFVAHRESLEWLRTALSHRAQLATAVFHEELAPARRDIEVARFRSAEGPSLLVSTECGGEGRNFEFCHRLVLFDLPWSPVVVEQRIGRLDRIGREIPVEIVYFEAPSGLARDAARLFEAIGLFREPLAGLEPELARIEAALDELGASDEEALSPERFAGLVRQAGEARDRVREAAYHELHRDPFVPERGGEILSRIPPDLDELNEDVVRTACERLGFHVEPQRGSSLSFELGNEAVVDSLPGVAGGTSCLGTFSRAEAVADETLDFFAAGHPLVEGVLAHLDESPLGRVAVLSVAIPGERGLGLLALYREDPGFEAVCVDASGRRRPEWAAALSRRPLRTRRVPRERLERPDWERSIRSLADRLDPGREPVALAALLVGG